MANRTLSDTIPSDTEVRIQPKRNAKSVITESRLRKPTKKCQNYALNMAFEKRKFLEKQVSSKQDQIEYLMAFENDLDAVKLELNEWKELSVRFQESAKIYQDKLDTKEAKDEAEAWLQSRFRILSQFEGNVESWIEQCNLENAIRPEDSVSRVGSKHSSNTSSASSAKMKIEAKKAELVARQKMLEQRHQLEEDENRLRQKREEEENKLRQRKEMLELQTEVEIANAQFEIFDQYERESHNQLETKKFQEAPKETTHQKKELDPNAREFTPSQNINWPSEVGNQNFDDVCRQQNDIIQLVMEHQKLATLPTRKIPVFSGDPLQFKTFTRAFEHGIEDKTVSPKDRLYYLDQYTSGEPNELVRSCIHMEPERGYEHAKSLLEKKFGNKYKLATAYMDKALNWSSIKPEDSEALNSFSIFLTSCGNTMKDIEYMRELEHPKNMKALIQKLPFKLRERWRTVAFNILENRNVTFTDLVDFVDKQAQIISSPLFGTIAEERHTSKLKTKQSVQKFRSFALTTNKDHEKMDKCKTKNLAHPKELPKSDTKLAITPRAFTKPCWYCVGDHSLERCPKFQCKTNQEKTEFLKPKGLCFGCLTFGHLSRDCPSRLTCHICRMTHATCFHDNSKDEQRKEWEQTKPKIVTNNSLAASAQSTEAKDHVSCMPVVPVRIKVSSSDRYINTYAFLDNGSSATFCTNKLAEDLQVSGKNTKIIVSTMNQRKLVNTAMLEDLEVGDIEGKDWVKLPTVFTQETMPISKSTIPKEEIIHQWPYLRNVMLPPIDAEIGLLIGNNVPRAVEPYEIINSDGDGPYAVRTILGWTVNGLVQGSQSLSDGQTELSVNRTDVLADENLTVQVQEYFNREFNERISNDRPEMSREDRTFLDIMNSSKKLIEGHYQLPLPIKDPKADLPNNKMIAEQRAMSLKNKFMKNETFYKDYKVFMQDLMDNDYAQKVPASKMNREDGKIWYIPHHGVYHPKKPDKIRVVFDCTAQYKGKSLNDHLLQGPDLTNALLGVLLRFRQESVALMADIEAMFYQVRVEPDDYDLLRFLWWPNGNLGEELQEYQMKVHIFGAASSPSCANFALKQTAKDNMDTCSEEVIHTLEKSFYVDDCLKSVSNESQAIMMSQDLREICQKGGFRLTKWISNSRTVIDSIPEEDRAKDVKELDMDEDVLPIERALGVQWCVESDKFKFKIRIKDKPVTRRGILSIVSSIYDPLGFAGPFVLKAKGILQDLCRLKIGWDDAIPNDKQKAWTKWISELPRLEEMAIDRCIQSKKSNQHVVSQIHHFSDASETGYGTVSYLRQVSASGEIHCTFLISKSRVAPLKQITIPRLELSAATLAVRVDSMLKRELEIPIDQTFFWTDSMSVLRYIHNASKRFQTFVANRLSVIHEGSTPSQWKYVDTRNNPADESSRGLAIDTFLKDTRWLSGPEFLWEGEEIWPQQTSIPMIISGEDSELKKTAHINLVDCNRPCEQIDKLISHYSDWFALKKAVAWILKVRKTLLKRSQNRKNNLALQQVKPSWMTVKDLENAEKAVIQYVQQQSFASELEVLSSNQHNKESKMSKNSSIYKLDPFVEDGLLKVGGRLSRAEMPESSKHPVILPKNSHVSQLIIQHIHHECGHSGRNHVLSQLFEKYWIIKANAAVRQVIHRCVRCRRVNASVSNQKMADLPAERVTPDEPPFTYVGVDYFGPFDVKQRRSRVKRYGVLFTCLTTRAVHIEVANSLDTDSCINALRRFISRRGQVKVMRSDNGTNFVGSERELREEIEGWNMHQIHKEMMQRNVEWMFNPPAGSHHGGVWERQIRTVRKILRSVLREQTLDEETLQTVLCEIESIINSRPISKASSDPGDLEALTPNHLLLMKRKPNLPPRIFVKEDSYPRRRWHQVQYMADIFWKRWLKEYLPLLQERQKWVKLRRNLKIDDIVLVVDNTAPRNSWSMGRITQLMPDHRGVVRRVRVKTQSSVLERPINKLCLLLESDC